MEKPLRIIRAPKMILTKAQKSALHDLGKETTFYSDYDFSYHYAEFRERILTNSNVQYDACFSIEWEDCLTLHLNTVIEIGEGTPRVIDTVPNEVSVCLRAFYEKAKSLISVLVFNNNVSNEIISCQ